MYVKSLSDLDALVFASLNKIPLNIDAVVGIPRSGMLLASIICMYVNKPLMTINELIANQKPFIGRFHPPRDNAKHGQVLVVDDAIGGGKTFREIKKELSSKGIKAIYLTAYACGKRRVQVDICLETIAYPRVWQWNVFHHATKKSMWDLDGVIVSDLDESLLIKPSFPVDICTGRQDRRREQTEEMLKGHGVQYKSLIMRPTGGEESAAVFKSKIYKNSDSRVFIESNPKQAKVIAEKSQKPVFCTSNRKVY